MKVELDADLSSEDPEAGTLVTKYVLRKRIVGVEFDVPNIVRLHLENGVILDFSLGKDGAFVVNSPHLMVV